MPARPLDRIALLDLVGRTEQHGPDIVLLEVHHDSPDAVLELQQLVGLRVLQAVDADHAVADLEHRAHLVETKFRIDPLELHPQHVRHLACLYTFRHTFQFFSLTFPAAAAQTIRRFFSANCRLMLRSCVATLASSRSQFISKTNPPIQVRLHGSLQLELPARLRLDQLLQAALGIGRHRDGRLQLARADPVRLAILFPIHQRDPLQETLSTVMQHQLRETLEHLARSPPQAA